ncbi:hypothetical protein J8I88_09355 [Duffyella gerundensis]|uniref:hypothetical protein n=1 Tax=Duffyella gerundensis TaxID=1619313 RepID=UPI001AE1F0B6|nr:hypothetical protein [Duffyella gerundensis]QTO52789.1 hypothetical protein J8I88_09355 [Duffyella gerundensis]
MSTLHSVIEVFILRSLQNMGVGPQTLNDIVRGADMYGPAGVLDSVHLVGLISDIGDAVERADMCSDTLFDILDGDLFLQFKNIESTLLFLSERFGNVNFSA